MAKFGHLTLSMAEANHVKEVRVDGKVVDNVFELNDKEGWVRRYNVGYDDLSNEEIEKELLKGEVEIIWDD